MGKISVVLGTYNRKHFLRLTINNVREELERFGLESEIIVIDGGSTDGTIKWLTKQKDIISIVQHNRGSWKGKEIRRKSWGYFMNLGFKCAQGKYICMISDDCLLIPNSIVNGYKYFEEKLNSGKKIGALAFYWREWPRERNMPYRIGTVFNQIFVNHGMFLKTALEDVGYIDEKNYKFYCADGDLCLRLKQNGYLCLASPDSYVEHYSHANLNVRKSNLKNAKTDQDYFYKKWVNYTRTLDTKLNCLGTINFNDKNNIGNKFKLAELKSFEITRNKIISTSKNLFKRCFRI